MTNEMRRELREDLSVASNEELITMLDEIQLELIRRKAKLPNEYILCHKCQQSMPMTAITCNNCGVSNE